MQSERVSVKVQCYKQTWQLRPWPSLVLSISLFACQAPGLTPDQFSATASGPDIAADAKDAQAETNDDVTPDLTKEIAQQETADMAGAECAVESDCVDKATACAKAYCVEGKCKLQDQPDGSACASGDKCKIGESCQSGTCKGGKAATCEDNDPCTSDVCDLISGCHNTPSSGAPCNDANACTADDICSAGKCVGKSSCACQDDEGCKTQNPCEGPRFCDKSAMPYVCKPKGTGVKCVDVAGDCSKTTCDPADGLCKDTPLEDKAACSDGIPCTHDDYCSAGQCKSDNDSCLCKSDKACMLKFSGGNYCNSKYICDKSTEFWQCKKLEGSATICPKDDDTDCRKFKCDPADGNCKFNATPDLTQCFDGDKCWSDTKCLGGKCANALTGAKICACTDSAQCKASEDGDLCNGTLICQDGQCIVNPVSVITCPKSTDGCMKTICNKKAGKCEKVPIETLKTVCLASEPNCGDFVVIPPGATPTAVACDDGDACTVGEACGQGQCTATNKGYVCDCSTDDQCLKSDAANKCKGSHYCDKALSKCLINPKTIVVCQTGDDTICQKNVCDKTTGLCKIEPIALSCDDNNACTADSCTEVACKHVPLADGSDCGNGLACKSGICLSK